MRILFVTAFAVLTLSVGRTPGGEAGKPALDGKWLIVYAEEGGRRNNAWEQRVATIKGDTLSYEAEEKRRSMQLTFGPNQTLSAKVAGEGKAKIHKGVYIAAQDYLCISLVTGGKAKDAGAGAAAAGAGQAPAAAAQKGGAHHSSGDFIVILRRQRAK